MSGPKRLKYKAEHFLNEEPVPKPKICKPCFEAYQNHKPVLHGECHYLLVMEGCGDAKAPLR